MSNIKKGLGRDPLDWIGQEPEQTEQPKEVKRSVGRPPKEDIQREGAGKGLPEEWLRYTLIMNKKTLEDLKDYAWYERLTIKEAVDNILSEFLDKADFERPKK